MDSPLLLADRQLTPLFPFGSATFTAEAKSFVGNIEAAIVLIDGSQLAQFVFDHNVRVPSASVFEVKKVDVDFFEED